MRTMKTDQTEWISKLICLHWGHMSESMFSHVAVQLVNTITKSLDKVLFFNQNMLTFFLFLHKTYDMDSH